MARKTAEYTVTSPGRDAGKVFLLTEMSADQAEAWGYRALLALMRSGVEIPDNIASAGLAGVAALGLQALGGLEWSAAEPLLAEMFACVQCIPNPAKPNIIRRLIADDIEEVSTRVMLRKELFELHTGFFQDAMSRNSAGIAKTKTGA